MKGNVVSAHERKKLFNKFERHSETARIFETEDNLNNFVADVYRQGPDRASQLSLTGRRWHQMIYFCQTCHAKVNIPLETSVDFLSA